MSKSIEAIFEKCAGHPGEVHNLMIDAQAHNLVESDPAAADTLTKSLQSVVDFQKGRGKMLRSIQPK